MVATKKIKEMRDGTIYLTILLLKEGRDTVPSQNFIIPHSMTHAFLVGQIFPMLSYKHSPEYVYFQAISVGPEVYVKVNFSKY